MNQKMRMRGFMLVEMLIVIAVLAALISIAVPNYLAYMEKARAASCLSNRYHIEQDKRTSDLNNDAPSLVMDNRYKCPSGGIYAWLVSDQTQSGYPSVACSLHYTPVSAVSKTQIAGLVGAWTMVEGQGNTVGTGQSIGTIHDAQWFNDPQRGTVLNFDGKNDYVEIPGDGVLKMPYNQITLSTWFKSGENFTDGIAPPGEKLIAKNSNFHLSLGPSGDSLIPGVDMYLDGKYVSAAGTYASGKSYADLIIKDNEWHNLAATYDGSTMSLYKDGVLILVKTGLSGTVGSAAGTSNSKLPVYLGAENGTSSFVNGSMDQAYIYNRALTSQEIQTLLLGQ
ncbi:MAG: LamG-like jellyroll fold domain-containing protein [Deltaproteobacteria bacterium]